jgi:hypothetical protein
MSVLRTALSSPAQRGRGTMRSMVEGARNSILIASFSTPSVATRHLPRFTGEDIANTGQS